MSSKEGIMQWGNPANLHFVCPLSYGQTSLILWINRCAALGFKVSFYHVMFCFFVIFLSSTRYYYGIPWQNSNQNKTIAQRTGTYLGENVRATIPAETAGNFAFYLRCGALDRVIGWERRDPNSAPLSVRSAPRTPAHPRAPPPGAAISF